MYCELLPNLADCIQLMCESEGIWQRQHARASRSVEEQLQLLVPTVSLVPLRCCYEPVVDLQQIT